MMIVVKDLSAGYSKVVISGVSFRVEKGEVVGIIGPNGSGKSTLLKTISALLKPVRGVVYLDGKNVHEMSPSKLSKAMAITTTERPDVGFLTGFEVVSLGRYPYTDAFGRLNERDVEVIMESLRLVNAEHLANKPFFEMSDGERQKILIARALAQEPRVLILDEPTSFLDAKHRIEISLLLRRIAIEKGIAVILTTHDLELALRVCDRIVMVKNGRIVTEIKPEDLNCEEITNLYELDLAEFDPILGTFEVKCEGKPLVHLVCGGGSGAKVMRVLARKGIPFTTGVIHENDIDCYVARRCAFEVVVERAFDEIREDSFKKALVLVKRIGIVLDTGFPIGKLNVKNLELLEQAESSYSLRGDDELNRLGIEAKSVDLSEFIKSLQKNRDYFGD